MRAWAVTTPGPIETGPIELREKPDPIAREGELLVRVRACGVCRTDLHVTEGDLPVHRPSVTPGHEIVGEVVGLGDGVTDFRIGERVGVAWLHSTDGVCAYCRRGSENLCPASRYTGWDTDGGYAELATVPAEFAYRLPDDIDDVEIAPLLCAGIIGYRALLRTGLLDDGNADRAVRRLGMYGFGGSAHLCAQLAIALGIEVHVFTRGDKSQQLARDLGAASVGETYDDPPTPLDAAITFAPVGEIVPTAMRGLDRGGVLSIAGIHLSDIPTLNYERELFYEKEIRSVTANTRHDGTEFLVLAARHGVRATTHPYPMSSALQALIDLKAGAFDGAAVLVPD
ncbi:MULTISPECIES: zinc-binding alcohol dehydrogenase family protein [unclassified Gordonia (in: high G+C Gram-positive bacteria)]|uniref:zinc-binding alcohol dehydrogenase family protein n=1 Tax=unclassified Gordonia (in: high G+C Gram-positive bacteria) TaxID=2657482 RepID=UPI001F111961|nr:zinc-binding alcohol dehydrogenase family protein [Gordonia sp. ABSL49_1]MCH5645074.1 zinc-binding alcohol dehydrogenase family protein [Gordonia sp. ABSL49_1]